MKNLYPKEILFSILFLVCIQNRLSSQCTFTSSVPYFEGFETSVTSNNQLPMCWAASNMSNTCLTYTSTLSLGRFPRTGSKFASFSNSVITTNYFYTNGIFLVAGVTYSTSVWYKTEFYGYTNWSNLSILMGTSQSPSGQSTIASTSGPAVSPVYIPLTNTFVAGSTGIHYFAIRSTNASTTGADYLCFDDFSIMNMTNQCDFTVVATPSAVCLGQSTTLTASGASSYSWSTGATSSSVVVTPAVNTVYTVSAYNATLNCNASQTVLVKVALSPFVAIFQTQNSVCAGKSATLTAFGADNYQWSNGALTNTIVVSPSVTTTYSVVGTNNQNGCSKSASASINVLPSPTLNISGPTSIICEGEQISLTVTGAQQYIWTTPGGTVSGAVLSTIAQLITYSVTGIDVNGCEAKTGVAFNFDLCTSMNFSIKANEFYVYPNPASSELNIDSDFGLTGLEIFDTTGKLIMRMSETEIQSKINIEELSPGLYCFRFYGAEKVNAVNVIKK